VQRGRNVVGRHGRVSDEEIEHVAESNDDRVTTVQGVADEPLARRDACHCLLFRVFCGLLPSVMSREGSKAQASFL
jgi:hypothetical protein